MTSDQILYAGITGCVAAIVILWRLDQVKHAETKAELAVERKRVDDCDTDRTAIKVRVARLEAGCGASECPMRKANG